VVLREFRGTRSELDFLKFIAEHAQVLEKMVIVLTHGHSPSDPVATNLRTRMASAKWANACCELMIFQTPFPQEGTAWCYLSVALGTKNRKPRTEPKNREPNRKNRADQFRFLIRFQKSRNRNNLGQFGFRVRLTELTRMNRTCFLIPLHNHDFIYA
jgi:hypothetical protein